MNKLSSIKNIRARMKDGKVSIGSWMQLKDSSVAEIMGSSGFDWVAVDMEHGAISHQQLPDLFRALELGGTLPLARVAEGTMLDCKQALDAGAAGVIIPMVETAKDLMTVGDACRWPPAGNRGVAFSRANLFGKNFDSYKEDAQSPFLVAMIENIHACNIIEEILSVEGLDAILIGPYDLSASLGITAEFGHPDFISMMAEIQRSALDANIPAGIHVVAPLISELNARIEEGYLFIPYSIDTVMLRNETEKVIGDLCNERRGY